MDRITLNPAHQAPAQLRVVEGFALRASRYNHHARLQRSLAWRLAHHSLELPLPSGPMADLGAGSGLVGQALLQQGFQGRLLQVDACPALLAHNPLAARHGALLWDLNQGLPAELGNSALLISSFVLQWLDRPAERLETWCRQLAPGGWLLLAVPTAGSFPQWTGAARAAGVRCTRWPLPSSHGLTAMAAGQLEIHLLRRLHFSLTYADGLAFLQQLKELGAGTSRQPPLAPQELRRLLQHWPSSGLVTWNVLLLIGQKLP
ncbi:methyltransferase domain-containing protein [Cyanobium sp. NIES-981]|uniref:methyltransferase domain-containing protein n=1 Tax=Cyanobium sp. NIES-981 TaxID=1851505 RepID=UPI0007DCDA86|nr:methyltransferase domain-containing protein [Cyanobium sp. NIES-981]SBO44607.1 SAM dependent methyltransferase [Cyanobium sp. NIES-981]